MSSSQSVKITWLGHAAFAMEFGAHRILVDPWISENPTSPGLPDTFVPTKILVTHGHFDHLGDAIELSKTHQVPVYAPGETAIYCAGEGATASVMNIGGVLREEDFAFKIVTAIHSSSVGPERKYGGHPAGFLLNFGGFRVYHAGDTAYFDEMSLVIRKHDLDLALLPIGGTTTMDPTDAIDAVNLLKPTVVVPMHYNTWEFIAQNESEFARRVTAETDSRCQILVPGQPVSFN